MMKSTFLAKAMLFGLILAFSGCGNSGEDGVTALISTVAEPAGANCTYGGIRVDAGMDDNGNDILESSEIDSTSYVCNGVSASTAPQITAGAFHSLSIKADSTLWAWGLNRMGELGDGTNDPALSPVQTGNALKWQRVAAGYDFTIAINGDGTLWGWGNNKFGQLGDGTTVSSSSPVQAGSDSDWKSIAAGTDHTVAIKTDRTLWAWGYNYFGQLGDGTNVPTPSPVQIGSDSNWKSVSAGASFTVAVRTDGSLWAWGYNHDGQLGDGSNTNKNTPVQIIEDLRYPSDVDYNWQSVAAGASHTLAIKTDGTLWAWGSNRDGQLGEGPTYTSRNAPVQIGTDTNWQSVAAGDSHSLAIKTDGSLWAWGNNESGQLGDGTTVMTYTPVRVGSDSNWQSVAAGGSHSLAVKTNNTLWAWGRNRYGQLGDGTMVDKHAPEFIY